MQKNTLKALLIIFFTILIVTIFVGRTLDPNVGWPVEEKPFLQWFMDD